MNDHGIERNPRLGSLRATRRRSDFARHPLRVEPGAAGDVGIVAESGGAYPKGHGIQQSMSRMVKSMRQKDNREAAAACTMQPVERGLDTAPADAEPMGSAPRRTTTMTIALFKVDDAAGAWCTEA
jgi:hypothetical protein